MFTYRQQRSIARRWNMILSWTANIGIVILMLMVLAMIASLKPIGMYLWKM